MPSAHQSSIIYLTLSIKVLLREGIRKKSAYFGKLSKSGLDPHPPSVLDNLGVTFV